MNLDEVIGTFIAESNELLEQMENTLLEIEQAPDDAERINAIFRAAHTIKGSAGLFGLDPIVAITHVAESVLDRVRASELAIDGTLVALLLEVGDHLSGLIGQLASDSALDHLPADLIDTGKALEQRLSKYLAPQKSAAVSVAPAEEEAPVAASGHWHISWRPGLDSLRNGMDPLALLRYLRGFGEMRVETLEDALTRAEDFDAESSYLGFEIALHSEEPAASIDGAFDFVREDGLLHLAPPGAGQEVVLAQLQALPEGEERLRPIFEALGSLTCAAALEADEASSVATVETPNAQRSADAPVAAPAAREKAASEATLIRVDAGKLDALINLVGELIIAGAGVRDLAQRSGLADMGEAAETLSRLVEEVRDSALTLRMVQIGATFNRFQRVVRDVSSELGKDIALRISGGDTELDKTVVEKIGDPLTHLVRNSMDHGIEAAELRQSRGKPLQGTVRLNAYHEAGGIVIEVSDDGGGLDPQKILAKAIQRGLVAEGQQLSDKDIFNLIFEPGFSTAEQVSNLSGRGVGMDVVKRNIAALRGTVELDSRLGEGTCVRIRLPLTLAIIDGFMIGIGAASYVVPLDMVEECIELPAGQLAGQEFLDLRGDVLPFIRLRQLFDDPSTPPRRESVVVVSYANVRAGLVVDQLLGEFQTVIKPLGRLFGQVGGLSGFTILGSGAVALILDIPGLLAQLGQAAHAPRGTTHTARSIPQ